VYVHGTLSTAQSSFQYPVSSFQYPVLSRSKSRSKSSSRSRSRSNRKRTSPHPREIHGKKIHPGFLVQEEKTGYERRRKKINREEKK